MKILFFHKFEKRKYNFLSVQMIYLFIYVRIRREQNIRIAFPDEITYRSDMAYFHDLPFTELLVDKR